MSNGWIRLKILHANALIDLSGLNPDKIDSIGRCGVDQQQTKKHLEPNYFWNQMHTCSALMHVYINFTYGTGQWRILYTKYLLKKLLAYAFFPIFLDTLKYLQKWQLYSVAPMTLLQWLSSILNIATSQNGPHLWNGLMTENWAYGRFHSKLGIYQCGHEWWLRSNLASGLSSCTQVFKLAWTCD